MIRDVGRVEGKNTERDKWNWGASQDKLET